MWYNDSTREAGYLLYSRSYSTPFFFPSAPAPPVSPLARVSCRVVSRVGRSLPGTPNQRITHKTHTVNRHHPHPTAASDRFPAIKRRGR